MLPSRRCGNATTPARQQSPTAALCESGVQLKPSVECQDSMIGPLACYFDQNSRLDADGIPVMSMLAQRIGSARRRGPPAGAGRQSTWCHARQGLSPAAVKCIRLLCCKARHSVRARWHSRVPRSAQELALCERARTAHSCKKSVRLRRSCHLCSFPAVTNTRLPVTAAATDRWTAECHGLVPGLRVEAACGSAARPDSPIEPLYGPNSA